MVGRKRGRDIRKGKVVDCARAKQIDARKRAGIALSAIDKAREQLVRRRPFLRNRLERVHRRTFDAFGFGGRNRHTVDKDDKARWCRGGIADRGKRLHRQSMPAIRHNRR